MLKMGCSSSKVDDLPVVSLCRERAKLIEEAVQQRYLLSAAHASYLRSLRDVGMALEVFMDWGNVPGASPVLTLPVQRKSDAIPLPPEKSKSPVVHSRAGSDHHIDFDSDSDFSVDHLDHSVLPEVLKKPNFENFRPQYPNSGMPEMGRIPYSNVPPPGIPYYSPMPPPPAGMPYSSMPPPNLPYSSIPPGVPYAMPPGMPYSGGTNYYYMRSRPTPSVLYEERPPPSPERVQWGQNYSNYTSSSGYSSFFGGGSSSYPSTVDNGSSTSRSAYGYAERPPPPQQQPPPPPPSPPRATTWDFLNLFDGYETYYPQQYPQMRYSDGGSQGSRDSRDVREEEGIPELEEDSQAEVVKEIHNDKRPADGNSSWDYANASSNYQKNPRILEADKELRDREVAYGRGLNSEGPEVVDKLVIEKEERVEVRNVAEFAARNSIDIVSAVKQIRIWFEKASESADDVSRMLEVGKLPYHHRNVVYKASAKMLGAITPRLINPSHASTPTGASSSERTPSGYLDYEASGAGTSSCSLSKTMEKLYIWEKKLLEEIRSEEKLRVVLERKRKQLKKMEERGSEPQKIEATRSLTRSLSTKIRIAIHFVESVASKINRVRDEELWPQINDLIHGFEDMWRVMHECHQNQWEIIEAARNLDYIMERISSESHVRATVQLELNLLNWMSCFYMWVTAHKGYVKALNGWLLNCLHQEPEVTPDGVVPFSPGRVGAPPVFVICHRWWQAIEVISEKEVVDAMRIFSLGVLQLWKRHNKQLHHELMTGKTAKDVERDLKVLQKDDQRINKAWEALNKKRVLTSDENNLALTDQVFEQGRAVSFGDLKTGLKHIFEAMVRFTDYTLRAYEELHLSNDRDQMDREHDRIT